MKKKKIECGLSGVFVKNVDVTQRHISGNHLLPHATCHVCSFMEFGFFLQYKTRHSPEKNKFEKSNWDTIFLDIKASKY
jgi:hypothetical protein